MIIIGCQEMTYQLNKQLKFEKSHVFEAHKY